MIHIHWAALLIVMAGATIVLGIGFLCGRSWQRATDHIAWDAAERDRLAAERGPQIESEPAGPDTVMMTAPDLVSPAYAPDPGRAGPPLTDRDDPRYYYPENRHALRELYAQRERDRQDQAAGSPWLAEMLNRDTGTWLAIHDQEIAEAEGELGHDRAE
jgi:hypothetical protein